MRRRTSERIETTTSTVIAQRLVRNEREHRIPIRPVPRQRLHFVKKPSLQEWLLPFHLLRTLQSLPSIRTTDLHLLLLPYLFSLPNTLNTQTNLLPHSSSKSIPLSNPTSTSSLRTAGHSIRTLKISSTSTPSKKGTMRFTDCCER